MPRSTLAYSPDVLMNIAYDFNQENIRIKQSGTSTTFLKSTQSISLGPEGQPISPHRAHCNLGW
jgi:hypothetical protein